MAGVNVLLLEGPDDLAVLYHLLRRAGLPIAERDRREAGKIALEKADGVHRLLARLRVHLKIQDDDAPVDTLGVILDADTDIDARWQSLRDILRGAGYTTVPAQPDPAGTIVAEPGRITFGVWLMPDNQLNGALERFVQALLPAGDQLWAHACASVNHIPPNARLFIDADLLKAQMHTWLAWQREPGCPMGLAITHGFLDARAPAAAQLIDWLRRLYGVAPA